MKGVLRISCKYAPTLGPIRPSISQEELFGVPNLTDFPTVAVIEVKRTMNDSSICTEQGFSLQKADCKEVLHCPNHKLEYSS